MNFKKGISIETFYFPALDLLMWRQKKETALFVVREDYTYRENVFDNEINQVLTQVTKGY